MGKRKSFLGFVAPDFANAECRRRFLILLTSVSGDGDFDAESSSWPQSLFHVGGFCGCLPGAPLTPCVPFWASGSLFHNYRFQRCGPACCCKWDNYHASLY